MRYDEAGAYEYGYAYGHGNDVDECKEQPGELHGNFANVVCLRVETDHSRSPLQQQQSYAYGIAYKHSAPNDECRKPEECPADGIVACAKCRKNRNLQRIDSK